MLAHHNQTDKRTTMRNKSRSSALGRPAMVFLGGLIESVSEDFLTSLQLVCGRPTLALSSILVPQTLSCSVSVEDF